MRGVCYYDKIKTKSNGYTLSHTIVSPIRTIQVETCYAIMKVHRLEKTILIKADIEAVWKFFSNPANLNEITPADMKFEILFKQPVPMYTGQMIAYNVRPVMNIPMRWVTEITHCEKQKYFVDEQRIGPYRLWHHEHHFKSTNEGVLMTDILHYALPMGMLGQLFAGNFVRKKVEGIFEYREKVITDLF